MNPIKINEALAEYEKEHTLPAHLPATKHWREANTPEERKLAHYLALEAFLIEEGYL